MVNTVAGTAPHSARSMRGAVVVAVAAVGVAATGFLPWMASGRATYSSYDLAGAARHLGGFDQAGAGGLAVAWVFVPLLASATVLAATTGRRRAAMAIATALAALVLIGLATLVLWDAPATVAPLTVGPVLALVATSALLIGVGLMFREERSEVDRS